MTFTIGHVEGGTGAGTKRPPAAAPKEWPCICVMPPLSPARYPIRLQGGILAERKANPGYLVRCPECREHRPGTGRGARH